jgi:hypothetical protein
MVNVVLRLFESGIDYTKTSFEAFCLFLPLLASLTVLFRPVQRMGSAFKVRNDGMACQEQVLVDLRGTRRDDGVHESVGCSDLK